MKKLILILAGASLVTSCSTSQKAVNGKTVLDTSKERAEWIDNPKLSWELDGKVFVRATHTIRGDQKLSGCYDLAKLDAKEQLLTEMSSDIKGSIDNADTELSENAEVILGKVRSAKYEGTVYGFKNSEQYYERYLINGVERIDCSILSEQSKSDYDKTKRSVVDKLVAVDSKLKEAVLKKQINFFSDREPSNQ